MKNSSNKKTERIEDSTPKVTGLGGIFFHTKNPQKVKDWYGFLSL